MKRIYKLICNIEDQYNDEEEISVKDLIKSIEDGGLEALVADGFLIVSETVKIEKVNNETNSDST